MKEPLLMRTAKNPNYKIDWKPFDRVDRREKQRESVEDVLPVCLTLQIVTPYGIQTQMYDVRLTIAIEISYKLINALIHVSFTSYEPPTLCTAMFVFSFCAFLELYHLSTIT
jgi:hypothetical protein